MSFVEYLTNRLTILNESSTQITAICPVCFGDKFKVNKKTGAYACYNLSRCTSEEIRKKLKLKKSERKTIPKKLQEWFFNINDEDIIFSKALKLKFPLHTCKFYYDFNKIKVKSKKEYTYLSVIEDVIIPSKINSYWNVYFPVQEFTEGFFICVEGEKDVNTLLSLGYSSFTFPTYSEGEIKYGLNKLVELEKFKGVVILNDNDLIGLQKAKTVEYYCSEFKIPYKFVDISSLIDFYNVESKRGMDITDVIDCTRIQNLDDYFKRNSRISIKV